MRLNLTWLFLILSGFSATAQELTITPLSTNPVLVKQYEEGNLFNASGQKINCDIELPFIDDFSKNHQPGAAVQLWDDNYVFINPTFGIDPPTYGVATFEGLDYNGYPYDFQNPDAYGFADVLTSCKIDLENDVSGIPYQISDSIIFSFYYQPQGRGFKPRTQDSLTLDFYDSDNDQWVRQWAVPGTALHDFELVHITILEERFLRNDFRFRFRNKGRLSGNLDHWNIDMVWLDKNRVSTETTFPDVGYQYPVSNLMNNYTSIPYKHFKPTAASHMLDMVGARLRNNQNVAVNLSKVKMRNFSQGGVVHESQFPGTINNFPPESSETYDIPVDGYVYDNNIDEPFVSFKNEFSMKSGTFDLVPDNDTIFFTQYFENYYSYDDGSAEAGIGFTTAGGRIAIRYQTLQGDSLIGLKIYFNPVYQDPTFPFFMMVWETGDNGPGEQIYLNQTFTPVQYIQEGHDIFAYYFFDEKVYVAGTFYVGISQSSDISLSIGYDRNTDNTSNTYYKTGISWIPLPDSDPGAVMIRPVFTSELDDVIMGISGRETAKLRVYPNPANNRVKIEMPGSGEMEMWMLTLDGRIVKREYFVNNADLDVSDIPSGMYLLRFVDNTGASKVEKILISH